MKGIERPDRWVPIFGARLEIEEYVCPRCNTAVHYRMGAPCCPSCGLPVRAEYRPNDKGTLHVRPDGEMKGEDWRDLRRWRSFAPKEPR